MTVQSIKFVGGGSQSGDQGSQTGLRGKVALKKVF